MNADERGLDGDEGKLGWWRVDGIRHSAITRAASAAEAIKNATQAGLVGDWEDPEARFWTEHLPNTFS
jgi:hypothetical protein